MKKNVGLVAFTRKAYGIAKMHNYVKCHYYDHQMVLVQQVIDNFIVKLVSVHIKLQINLSINHVIKWEDVKLSGSGA